MSMPQPDALSPDSSHVVASADDLRLVEALLAGDETAFSQLIDQFHASMLRLAMVFVPDRAVAEEVVQDAWIGILRGLPRFEGRSSLKTWMFRILTNTAKTRGQREDRSVPFSALARSEIEIDEPALDADRFMAAHDPHQAPGWVSLPRNWDDIPEDRLLAQETLELVGAAIDQLPPGQRNVITLRDIEGWTSEEVCNVLEISASNQRVLLHRARSKVRQALERYFDEE